jgi:hypothetical protein
MAADGQRYASPDGSLCEARASACVSIYSRMFVTLPSRTVMSKTQFELLIVVEMDSDSLRIERHANHTLAAKNFGGRKSIVKHLKMPQAIE